MTTAYRAARIFDGVDMIEGGRTVVVDRGVVVDVTTGPVPAGCDVLDLADATILPGLVDAHVHLIWDASAVPQRRVADESAVLTAFRAARNAMTHLRAGVTSVRDLGSTDGIALDVAEAIRSRLVAGPRVVAAGRAITMTGGHVHYIGREADGPDAVCHAVRAELKAGAECVKVMASGGVLGPRGEKPGAAQLTVAELTTAVAEAHRAGRPVAAHAHSLESITNALDADVDSIEHGSRLDEPTAERMREQGVYLVPTLSPVRSICRDGELIGLPADTRAKAEQLLEATKAAFGHAVRCGTPLAAGTDAGVPTQPHGMMWRELVTMAELGCPPELVLRAATSSGADLLGLGGGVGRIAPGAPGDLVVVDGDPRVDMSVLRSPTMVLYGGKIVAACTSSGLVP